MRRLGKRTAIISTALSVLLVAGVAFAAWTADGSGNGSATAGDNLDVEVDGGTVEDMLYPTGESDVTVTVTNPNPYAVQVTNIDEGTAGPATAAANCTDSTVTWSGDADGYDYTETINAGASHTFVLSDAVAMSNLAEDACQNAEFTVPVDVTAASAPAEPTAP